ncbi:hypothetical protein K470DRAFT_216814 [Piedraia hortae CBS 480.64]|uniref:NAD(P)-binding domain-containing protein n=1 Tax=Piedraia hortae CBS 480.64 TaxID=1314780 RepID=A0A6A7BZ35_9PEZI|nr:hypothetical protein K470DRAFT_216814 [Piedraia hortae CBS 480.64]
MATACVVGSTGLVGSRILSTLQDLPSVSSIYAFSRRDLPAKPKTTNIVSADSDAWAGKCPATQVFLSALGTTRAQAGSTENQKKIDYGLNLELARAAKAAGTKIYVLISSQGASSSSFFAYPKMKGELEDAVRALDFDHAVIVRPGLILGERSDARFAESALKKLAGLVGGLGGLGCTDPWAQSADTIAKAAVRAALDCVEGKSVEKVQILNQADIVKLGRTEWKA